MKILVICKRQYTNRDLIDDSYGRLFEIPEELTKVGHEVQGITISYRKKTEGVFKPKNVVWHSINGYPFINFIKISKAINALIIEFNPDIIWASSDVFILYSAVRICKKKKIPIVIDFYDNYESFGLTKLPFVKSLLANSCRNSSGITSVTRILSQLISQNYKIHSVPIIEIGNAASHHFFPIDKKTARNHLGLPENGLLIGTAGALDKSRGIEILFKAFSELKKRNESLFLVIAGPRDNTINKHPKENIIDLGILEPRLVPFLFNSLDIAVICNKNSEFGKYCYPQKYEEIIACHTPVLAANIGELALKLSASPKNIFEPDNPKDLIEKIELMLNSSHDVQKKTLAATWQERAYQLHIFLLKLIKQH